MLNPILAHTSSGVETVSQLDKDALDKLATWLCEENAYHDKHYYSRQQREHNVEADDRRYDAEYKPMAATVTVAKTSPGSCWRTSI